MNNQLAVVDNEEVKGEIYLSGVTVTIHPISVQIFNVNKTNRQSIHLKEFCLSDDRNVSCLLQIDATRSNTDNICAQITFNRRPTVNQYEISLYFISDHHKLEHIQTLHTDTAKDKKTFVFSKFADKFGPGCYHNRNIINECCVLCTKISRKDIPYVFAKKPALRLPSQITDCSLLFEKNALANFVIVVENREFRVHKEILASKSSVFLAMFDSEMKEKKENKMTIEDIEAEVFHEFLRYIYTNIVNELNTHAEKLFVVADKYDLSKLRLICIDELTRSLKIENAIHTLMFADRYNTNTLKERAIEFIKWHIKSIVETEDYKRLYQSKQAYLLNEIILSVI